MKQKTNMQQIKISNKNVGSLKISIGLTKPYKVDQEKRDKAHITKSGRERGTLLKNLQILKIRYFFKNTMPINLKKIRISGQIA